MARELSEAPSFTSTVDEIVSFARDTLETRHAGITLVEKHGFRSAGVTDPAVAEADRLQYDLREGPCLDTVGHERVLWSSDLVSDPRWPRWGPRADALGFHSILSAELVGGGVTLGALNLYGERHRQFDAHDASTATVLAFHAAVALASAREQEHLRQALDTRTLIGQAQGILAERYSVTPDHAFHVLRRYSQTTNTKLRDVARQVVEEHRLPEMPDDEGRGRPSETVP